MARESVVYTDAMVLIEAPSTAAGSTDSYGEFYESTDTTPKSFVDISEHVMSVNFERTYDLLDDTVMGETARSRKAGLETVSATLELIQRFTSNANPAGTADKPGLVDLDLLLNALSVKAVGGTGSELRLRPKNAVRSGSNPEYAFLTIPERYQPMNGAVGEILKTNTPFQSAGGSVTRRIESTS